MTPNQTQTALAHGTETQVAIYTQTAVVKATQTAVVRQTQTALALTQTQVIIDTWTPTNTPVNTSTFTHTATITPTFTPSPTYAATPWAYKAEWQNVVLRTEYIPISTTSRGQVTTAGVTINITQAAGTSDGPFKIYWSTDAPSGLVWAVDTSGTMPCFSGGSCVGFFTAMSATATLDDEISSGTVFHAAAVTGNMDLHFTIKRRKF